MSVVPFEELKAISGLTDQEDIENWLRGIGCPFVLSGEAGTPLTTDDMLAAALKDE